MKKIPWDRLMPLGLDRSTQLRWLRWGLLAGPVTNLQFTGAFSQARRALYHYWSGGGRLLREGAVMAPFSQVLTWGLYGCYAAAAAMAALAFFYWRQHYRGSRSIYLMRRLPDRWELARRCLGLPLLGAGLYLLEALCLRLLDFGIYRLLTPAQCLLPGQGPFG